MNKRFFLLIVLATCVPASAGEPIKLGTLAPERSAWGRVLGEMDAELREESGQALQFKFYFGRDETDLVALLKNGQLDAASLTSVGLSQVLPAVSVFQLPMLFSTYEELDYVKRSLTGRFAQLFAEEGYVLLGWGDLGFIYLFSKQVVRTQTDLQKTRFWVRSIDPIARAFAAASGREPVLLPIESVLAALAGGEVQTVYTSPFACLVYQWQTQIRYMTDLRLAAGVAATIVSKARFDALAREEQAQVRGIAQKHHEQLIRSIRASNDEAVRVLEGEGIELVSVPHQEVRKWRQVAVQVQDQFAQELYPEELLDAVRGLLQQYRTPEAAESP